MQSGYPWETLVVEPFFIRLKMTIQNEHVASDDQDWENRRPQIFSAEISKVYGAYIGVATMLFGLAATSWIGSSHHRNPAPPWFYAMVFSVVLMQLFHAIYLQTVSVRVDASHLQKKSIFGRKSFLLSDTSGRRFLQPRIGYSIEIRSGHSVILMTL